MGVDSAWTQLPRIPLCPTNSRSEWPVAPTTAPRSPSRTWAGGRRQGWRVLAGGLASGINPRLADIIATNLSNDEALALAARVLDWFKPAGKKRRLGKIINEIGLARFKENWA